MSEHKIVKVTNQDMMADLERVRDDIHAQLDCKRRPGCMVAIDALVQFYFAQESDIQGDFLCDWTTRVIGYNSEGLAWLVFVKR